MNKYDPIMNSLTIYMDAINIFVRMAMILGESKKKNWNIWKYLLLGIIIFFSHIFNN